MKKIKYFLIIIIILLFQSCNRSKTYKNNKIEFDKLIVKKNNKYNRHELSIKFTNHMDDTLVVIFTPKVMGFQEEIKEWEYIYNSIILEIKQNNKIIRSNEFNLIESIIITDHTVQELIVIKPDTTVFCPISFYGTLTEMFKLDDTDFYVRLVIIPEKKPIFDLHVKYLKNHPDYRIMTNKIVTSWVKVKS